MKIRLVVIGRGYDAVEDMPEQWDVPEDASVEDIICMLLKRYGDGPGWAASCLVALRGRHLGTVGSHEPATLREGDELTLIAPVAGG